MPLRSTSTSPVDVVGICINATDTVIRLPHFPSLDSKVEILSSGVKAGGQVASARVACQRWGLRSRYIGKSGDDSTGEFQKREMEREGVDAHWTVATGCSSQTSYILVDQVSGERTLLWKRDPEIALRAADLKKSLTSGTKALLVDGHDTEAATQAAQWAKGGNVPVVGDFDNRYPGVESLLEKTDFIIFSMEFPARITDQSDLLRSLPGIFENVKCHIIVATLGRLGALCWDGLDFHLCRGFEVRAINTTGVDDIFHAAFLYAPVHGWHIQQILEFSCSATTLNCKAAGARGGIASIEGIEHLLQTSERSEAAFSIKEPLEAEQEAKNAGLVRSRTDNRPGGHS